MSATPLETTPGTASIRELSMAASHRARALPRRRANMSAAEFALLVIGWGAAVGGILAISLLVRSFE